MNPAPPSCRDLSLPARPGRRRVLAGAGLLAGLLLAALIPSVRTGQPGALAAGVVHVRVQGHIVALASSQIKVRDRRGAVHTILLNGTTTYWYKLVAKSVHDLKMGMRVYVTGLPNKDGTVLALKIHLYYPVARKAKKSSGGSGTA